MCGHINSHATVHVCYYVLFAHFTFKVLHVQWDAVHL